MYMAVLSEKERYYNEFLENSRDKPYDIYLWGEELLDKKLSVYPGKLNAIQGYKKNIKHIINCGLVVINFNQYDYMRFTSARLDVKNNCVYISEKVFDSCWRDLRNSVDLGIRMAKEKDENFAMNDANEIINLDNLSTSKRVAYLKKNRLCYRVVEQSEETKRLLGRRQSLLDNPKMRCFYASSGGYVHDKDCELVQTIPLELFEASEKAPKHSEYCRKCKRRLLVRVACSPYVKQVPSCVHFLKDIRISNKRLEKAILGDDMKFNFQSPSEFYIKCNEDTWMIDGSDKSNLKLFHNNYAVMDETTRCILSGYHNQNQDGKDFKYMIDYITDYTWEKHLEAKRRHQAGADNSVTENSAVEMPIVANVATVDANISTNNKETIIARAGKFFKRLIRKIFILTDDQQ